MGLIGFMHFLQRNPKGPEGLLIFKGRQKQQSLVDHRIYGHEKNITSHCISLSSYILPVPISPWLISMTLIQGNTPSLKSLSTRLPYFCIISNNEELIIQEGMTFSQNFAAPSHHGQLFFFLQSKKCWVKYNPALGKIWTNPAIGLFRPSGWVTAI